MDDWSAALSIGRYAMLSYVSLHLGCVCQGFQRHPKTVVPTDWSFFSMWPEKPDGTIPLMGRVRFVPWQMYDGWWRWLIMIMYDYVISGGLYQPTNDFLLIFPGNMVDDRRTLSPNQCLMFYQNYWRFCELMRKAWMEPVKGSKGAAPSLKVSPATWLNSRSSWGKVELRQKLGLSLCVFWWKTLKNN